MGNRTKTYIAGDWDADKDLIDALYSLNDSKSSSFHFVDAHSMMQARDDSLSCSIKKNLAQRLDASKNFVLIVGDHTAALTKGYCYNCGAYSHDKHTCPIASNISHKSFIEYECDKAVRDNLNIVVLYKGTSIDRDKCPESVRWKGKHLPAYKWDSGRKVLDWFPLYLEIAF